MSNELHWLASYSGDESSPKNVVLLENLTKNQFDRVSTMASSYPEYEWIWGDMPVMGIKDYRWLRIQEWRRKANTHDWHNDPKTHSYP